MKNLSILFAITLLFLSVGYTQQGYIIDLGGSQSETIQIPSGENITVRAINFLPDRRFEYQISVLVKNKVIDELIFPSSGESTEGKAPSNVAETTEFRSCEELQNQIDLELEELYGLDSESELKETRLEVEAKFSKWSSNAAAEIDSTKKSCMNTLLEKSKNYLISITEQELWSTSLKRGQTLEITIKRVTGSDTKTWQYNYVTGKTGEWQTSFGFSFVPPCLNPETSYFTSPQGNNIYSILPESTELKAWRYIPSIFFSWEPIWRKCASPVKVAFSGGLGLNIDNPTVFLASTFSYQQNIKLHLGGVLARQYQLEGRYKKDQTVMEPLTFDQLHTQIYRPNFFIGLSFRFAENPFNQGDTGGS